MHLNRGNFWWSSSTMDCLPVPLLINLRNDGASQTINYIHTKTACFCHRDLCHHITALDMTSVGHMLCCNLRPNFKAWLGSNDCYNDMFSFNLLLSFSFLTSTIFFMLVLCRVGNTGLSPFQLREVSHAREENMVIKTKSSGCTFKTPNIWDNPPCIPKSIRAKWPV